MLPRASKSNSKSLPSNPKALVSTLDSSFQFIPCTCRTISLSISMWTSLSLSRFREREREREGVRSAN